MSAVQAAYDAVAGDYAIAFGDDLASLPIDRGMLDAALAAAEPGWVVELGCGPAPAAGYLTDRVQHLVGVDLSATMLAVAGRRHPGLRRIQADMRQLPLRPAGCALVIAYYSIQHLPRAQLPMALAEIHRVLNHRGVLLVATHLGDGDVYTDEFLGHRISTVGGALYRREELVERLISGGFRIEEERQRGPLAHEHDSQRIYLLARTDS